MVDQARSRIRMNPAAMVKGRRLLFWRTADVTANVASSVTGRFCASKKQNAFPFGMRIYPIYWKPRSGPDRVIG
jgi:hypothetical protein